MLLFAGCSKDDDFILRGTYYLSADASMGAIRMFTVNGEVMDGKIINDFLNTRINKLSANDTILI